MKTVLFSMLAVALFACHSEKPADAPAGKDAHGDAKDEHAGLSAPVKAFHDEMSPLWHADKSAERTAKTCDSASSLQAKATAVGDKDLVDATAALAAECAKPGRPDFEAKFGDVHTKFHKAAKIAEHGEHADHH